MQGYHDHMSTVCAFIISGNGELRNPELLKQVQALGITVQIITNAQSDIEIDFTKTRLSSSEYKCKYNHQRALNEGLKIADWVLVLEDDAEIDPNGTREFVDRVIKYSFTRPTIISLYPNPYSLVSMSPSHMNLWKCVIPPPVAVAYLANKPIEKLLGDQCDTVYPPDWPIWGRKVDFYTGYRLGRESGAISTLEETRKPKRDLRDKPLTEFLSIGRQTTPMFALSFLTLSIYYKFITKFRKIIGYRFLMELL
jgi:hypothetical protein